jgi:hypothetical protein
MRFPYDLFCVLLYNCVMRFLFFCPLWDFMLFVAYFVLICVSHKSPPWNAVKSVCIYFWERLAGRDVTWTHAPVVQGFGHEFRLVPARRGCKRMHESEFGSGGADHGICWEGASCVLAVMTCPVEVSCVFGHCEISLWDDLLFAAEFSYEICFRDFWLSCRCELSTWNLSRFAAYFSDEMPWWDLILVGRYEMYVWDFLLLLHIFRARYPNKMSCLFGPLRALRMRIHACWAVMRFLDKITCFCSPNFLVDGLMFEDDVAYV